MKNIILRYTLLIASLLAAFVSQNAHAQSMRDDSIRASYMLHFVDFVHWDRDLSQETTIGVIGSPAFHRYLKSAAEKLGGARTFEILELTPDSNFDHIDLVYISAGNKEHWNLIIQKAKDSAVVTVGEENGFLNNGGLIEFVIRKNRLRFSLNHEEAETYRLAMSSKLVQLSVNTNSKHNL